jgi:hypothetical protein
MFSATKPLVLGTLDSKKPVMREMRHKPVSATAAELAAARTALLDTRKTADRVIDCVVDRMLEELSW